MVTYTNLDVSDDGRVFRITFDNPDKRNAIDSATHHELTHVFRDADESDASVVMLTGSGEAFSAGGDFDNMRRMVEGDIDVDELLEQMHESERIVDDIVSLKKPLIARINGDAVGSAATYALFSDVTIASSDAKIGDPHVRAGLVAGDGGTIIWPLLVGLNHAKEYLLTGDLVSAEKAADIGLINYAVPPDELDDKVDEIVDKLTDNSQVAIRYTKVALNGWIETGLNNMFRESLAVQRLTKQHEDHLAAVTAFLDGEEPDFPSASDERR